MSIIVILAPFSLALALLGLAAFWWTLRHDQYEDPQGDASRILIEDPDDRPRSHELTSRVARRGEAHRLRPQGSAR
jgi:cbb3-type cytochrome oxidase maturation protein